MPEEQNAGVQQQDNNGAVVTTSNNGMSVELKNDAAQVGTVLDDVVNEGQAQQQQTVAQGQQQQTLAQGQQQQEAGGTNTATQQLAGAKQALDDAQADLATKGVDFNAMEQEFTKNGSLSTDSYSKLEAAGYPKSVVNGVIAGWQAAADRYVNTVTDMAGGQEDLQKLQQFVLSQGNEMRQAYNDAINSENLGQIQLVFAGIKAKMTAAFGTAKSTIIGNSAATGESAGYQTTAEMIKDMSDPRYQKDAAFTKEVYRKVKNSTIF